MDRGHGLDPPGPRTHRRGQYPRLEIGSEMALGKQDDIEARPVGGAQDLPGEGKGGIDLGRRQWRQRPCDGLLDLLRSGGDVGNRCVEAELHRRLLARNGAWRLLC